MLDRVSAIKLWLQLEDIRKQAGLSLNARFLAFETGCREGLEVNSSRSSDRWPPVGSLGSSGSDTAAPQQRSAPTSVPRGSDGGTEQPEKIRRGGDILSPTPEQWYPQDDEHMRGAVLVGFPAGNLSTKLPVGLSPKPILRLSVRGGR